MTTMADIVRRAHRKIGVVAEDETLSADAASEGVEALNAMLHAWKLRGADIQHTTAAAGDAFPLEPEYEEGAVYMLAARLTHDFVLPPTFDPDMWMRELQAAFMVVPDVAMPAELRDTPSQRRIERGA